MSRLILLSLLALPGVAVPYSAVAQEATPVVPPVAAPPVTAPPVEPLPPAPDPGDLSQPTPPIVPPMQDVAVPPPVTLPAPPVGTPGTTGAPDEPVIAPLTADEAARIALRLQPDVVSASAEILAAQGRTQQARSALRPTFGISSGYTQQRAINDLGGNNGGGGGGNGTPDAFSSSSSSGLRITATARQLLFDFNRTRDAVRAANLRERAATANLTRVQSDLVLTVKQAFYTLVQNNRLVAVSEANLKNRQDQLALTRARLGTGLGAPADVVRAQTAVAEAVFDLETARNVAATSRVNLALQMGIDARTPIEAQDSGEPQVATDDVNSLVDQGLKQRPETQQAQANIDAAQFNVKVARKTNKPSLGASIGAGSRSGAFGLGNGSVRATLDLEFTPFDGGLTKGLVREAQAEVLASQAELSRAQQAIASDVSQAYLNLRTAERRIISADAGVTNAEESVRIAEGRYRAGVAAFIEVTDAQTALISARTNRVNAQSSLDQARAALSRAIGAPLPVETLPVAPIIQPVTPAPVPAAPVPLIAPSTQPTVEPTPQPATPAVTPPVQPALATPPANP